MVDMGISSNIMKSPSPECYMTFWDMIIYKETLHWSDIITELDPITVFDVITLFRDVSIWHLQRMRQRTLTPPDTWSCPIWDLHLMLRPFFPELVMSTDLLSFEHPRYFYFAHKSNEDIASLPSQGFACLAAHYICVLAPYMYQKRLWRGFAFEFIGVLRHMQRYFSHICDGTDVQADWRMYLRSGSQRHRHFAGFFNVPVLHRHGTTLFIRWFRHTAHLVAFNDTLGLRKTYSRLKPPGVLTPEHLCAVTYMTEVSLIYLTGRNKKVCVLYA